MSESAHHAAARHLLYQDMKAGRPRYLRAKKTTDAILQLLRDFLPTERETLRRVEERLMVDLHLNNVAMITVPEEWDALNELQIKDATLKAATNPRIYLP